MYINDLDVVLNVVFYMSSLFSETHHEICSQINETRKKNLNLSEVIQTQRQTWFVLRSGY